MVSFSFLNAMDPTTIVFIVLLVVLIAALLIVPMFTNKKRAKQTEELHRSLQPGDVVKTVGGIIGTIKEIREVSPVDKEMVIETGVGDNKTTMIFDLAALYMVMSRVSAPAAEEPVFDNVDEENKEEKISADEQAPKAEVAEPVKEENETVAVKEEQSTSETVATDETEKPSAEAEQAVVEETQSQAETSEEKPAAKKPAAKKPVNTAKKTSGAKSTKK